MAFAFSWPAETESSGFEGGIGDTGFHTVCWYEREFEIGPGNGRTILHFGAVDYRAAVWLDGTHGAIQRRP